jgi:hypothetical protein
MFTFPPTPKFSLLSPRALYHPSYVHVKEFSVLVIRVVRVHMCVFVAVCWRVSVGVERVRLAPQ